MQFTVHKDQIEKESAGITSAIYKDGIMIIKKFQYYKLSIAGRT